MNLMAHVTQEIYKSYSHHSEKSERERESSGMMLYLIPLVFSSFLSSLFFPSSLSLFLSFSLCSFLSLLPLFSAFHLIQSIEIREKRTTQKKRNSKEKRQPYSLPRYIIYFLTWFKYVFTNPL
ncbi:hypothetical protein V8B55DRAFT_1037064 [Mucor lusitanicus]